MSTSLSTAELFREGIQSHFGQSRGRTNYPASLRALAVQHWETKRRCGVQMRAVAKELGVEVITLRSWASASRPTMRPVVVEDSTKNRSRDTRPKASISHHPIVRCPNGVCIEGLSIDDVLTLVRGLLS